MFRDSEAVYVNIIIIPPTKIRNSMYDVQGEFLYIIAHVIKAAEIMVIIAIITLFIKINNVVVTINIEYFILGLQDQYFNLN